MKGTSRVLAQEKPYDVGSLHCTFVQVRRTKTNHVKTTPDTSNILTSEIESPIVGTLIVLAASQDGVVGDTKLRRANDHRACGCRDCCCCCLMTTRLSCFHIIMVLL